MILQQHEQRYMDTMTARRAPLKELAVELIQRPEKLASLRELKGTLAADWEEDGFTSPSLYLDADGEPIVVSPKRQPGEMPRIQRDRTGYPVAYFDENVYRFWLEGEVFDVTIPPEVRGEVEATQEPSFEVIYDFTGDKGGNTPRGVADLPEGLQRLREKFGEDRLMMSSRKPPGAQLIGKGAKEDFVAYKLEDAIGKMKDIPRHIDAAHEQASRIEDDARQVTEKMKKRLFETATGFDRRKLRKHRRAVEQHDLSLM